MKQTTFERLQQKVEDCGWTLSQDDSILTIRNHSPLGEDITFEVNDYDDDEKTIQEIVNCCRNFDIDEHASFWIECRDRPDVPDSVYDLVCDAKRIYEMLQELADHIEGKESYDKDSMEDFIKRFAHFMSCPDLNAAYESHFEQLGYMSCEQIEEWFRDLLDKWMESRLEH